MLLVPLLALLFGLLVSDVIDNHRPAATRLLHLPVALAQGDITDADLERASRGRSIALGQPAKGGPVTLIPLEVYVARVLAGEGEPAAPEAARQALAVAIRTFAIFNAARHRRDGYDMCDTTHCQVPRASNPATRRAAASTAGRILTYNGSAAEVFYSASCGGRSESASAVWPAASLPYLRSVADDVHDGDEPWTLTLTVRDVQRALGKAGFVGRLTAVRIESRNESGRVARVSLAGLQPAVVGGDQFRLAIGAGALKSTAFSLDDDGETLRFTGRGYGHGVGLCVIGAGRRARRGESVDAILATYYPGLELSPLDPATLDAGGIRRRAAPAPPVAVAPSAATPPHPTTPHATTTSAMAPTSAAASAAAPAASPAARAIASPPETSPPSGIVAHVPAGLSLTRAEIERLAIRARDVVSRAVGSTVAPISIDVHDSLEAFRSATGRPWWVNAAVRGTAIDLAPPAVLGQGDGVEAVLRVAIAEVLVAPAFTGRAEWVRAGAARYFARQGGRPPIPARLRCPADAELTLAISAAAQRDAESRAEACFARAYARTRDWRSVR